MNRTLLYVLSRRTARTMVSAIAILVTALGCATQQGAGVGRTDVASAPDALAAALASLSAGLDEGEASIRSAAAFGSEIERARGYEFLLRSLIQSLEAELLQDPDFPYFRILDFWLRGGGDNPDQRYAFSPVRGGEGYRIRGELGSARRVEVQLYSGQPWAGSGRSVGYLAFDEIPIREDGSFVVELVGHGVVEGERVAGAARLPNPDDATTVFVRHIFDEWDERRTGAVHIDRLGYDGERKPPASPDEVAARIREAAANFALRAKTWPAFVDARYLQARPPNTLSPLVDTYALGGVRGRWMANGSFALGANEALVVRTWPTGAAYQAIQLTDLWFDSLEYGNQVSSLNTRQALAAPDGAYYHVVSASDPGYANWLDTGGLTRGVLLLRYDGVAGEIPPALHPSAEIVALDALADHIPGFVRTTEEERRETRAGRRRHLQIRSGR